MMNHTSRLTVTDKQREMSTSQDLASPAKVVIYLPVPGCLYFLIHYFNAIIKGQTGLQG